MKTTILLSVLVAICGSAPLFCENLPYKKMTLSEFGQQLYDGVDPKQFGNVLVECPAGSELPFKFSLRGDVFCFEPTQDVKFSIKLVKTCYLKFDSSNGLVFSTDLHHWKDFAAFFIGQASASFNIENNVPVATFEMELHENTNRIAVPIGSSFQSRNHVKYEYGYHDEETPRHTWTPAESQTE